MTAGAVVNALSVDVEEHYHAAVFQAGTRRCPGAGRESRVEESVRRVLDLLGPRGVRATFFVLGEVARARPGVVRRIAGDGHELGSHGHRHLPVSTLSPDEFRADVRAGKRAV
jgi:peptidoglycan/xylan/chitin deacetylase (PgdA/CDA1 family)